METVSFGYQNGDSLSDEQLEATHRSNIDSNYALEETIDSLIENGIPKDWEKKPALVQKHNGSFCLSIDTHSALSELAENQFSDTGKVLREMVQNAIGSESNSVSIYRKKIKYICY